MEKMKKMQNILPLILLFTLVISVAILVFRIFTATEYRSDYILMLIQSLVGILAMFLPSIISKKFKLEIPSVMYVIFIVFLYCSIVLGEIRNFYYHVPYWDKLLHMFSGAMLGALGFSLVSLLNKNVENVKLSPVFISFFSFCFALTLGVFWEFYEFTFDGILGLNMQKFMLYDGTILVGRDALVDTMTDLRVDALGAFIMSLIGYISLKYDKEWINKFLIKYKTKSKK